jgi:hypothetical protein
MMATSGGDHHCNVPGFGSLQRPSAENQHSAEQPECESDGAEMGPVEKDQPEYGTTGPQRPDHYSEEDSADAMAAEPLDRRVPGPMIQDR